MTTHLCSTCGEAWTPEVPHVCPKGKPSILDRAKLRAALLGMNRAEAAAEVQRRRDAIYERVRKLRDDVEKHNCEHPDDRIEMDFDFTAELSTRKANSKTEDEYLVEATARIMTTERDAGSISCPKCGKSLAFSRVGKKRAIRALCETGDCLRFME